MARINEKHGGRRSNSGRKSKAEEMGLKALLDKCWSKAQREQCIRGLAETANNPAHDDRMDALKLLMAYTFGKPKESIEHSGTDGGPISLRVIYVDSRKGDDRNSPASTSKAG